MPSSDFNGDGLDDILWRHTNGTISNWLSSGNGSFSVNDENAISSVGNDWVVVGAGDFDGDGHDDLLWYNMFETRDVSNWLATEDGGWLINDAAAYVAGGLGPDDSPLGVGDFNGDGRDDIIWEHEWLSTRTIWLAKPDGGFDSANPMDAPDDWSWHNLIGDFNGDGLADILWYGIGDVGNWDVGNWLGTESGTFDFNHPAGNPDGAGDWHIVGIGDFNDDGRDDILWRSEGGAVSNWLATETGGFTVNDANAYRQVSTDWHVVGVGDYNGDGNADILWRHDSGALSNWLGTDTGGFIINDANAMTSAPVAWHVEDNLSGQDPTWFT